MCSTARQGGSLTVLYPEGATTLHDIPWFLQEAIQQGFMILSWYENYAEKEVPPEYLWEDGEGLERWFKRVNEDRGWGNSGDEVPEDSDMMSNDLSRMFKD